MKKPLDPVSHSTVQPRFPLPMSTPPGCKSEPDICPAIHPVNKQISGAPDLAPSMIHITGTHTDPAYVIHLKYKYLPEYQLQPSKWAAFVIDRPNSAVRTHRPTPLLFCLLESDDIFTKQPSYTGYAGPRHFTTSHL